MKEIELSQGMVTMVDDEDFEWLNQWKWYVHKSHNTYYAHRNENTADGKRRTVIMHRMLVDLPSGYVPDHIDGNGLNNQRSNLRAVTVRQNNQNNPNRQKGVKTSKYPGVYSHTQTKKWVARITIDGKMLHIGTFSEEVDAFRAYYDRVISLGETVIGFPYPEIQQ